MYKRPSNPLLPAFLLAALAGCDDMAPGPAIVSISPARPTALDDLTANLDLEAIDLDGDTVSYSYTWYRDEEKVSEISGTVVEAEHIAKGEVWKVEVFASDGTYQGPTTWAQVTVGNLPPEASVDLDTDAYYSSEDITPQVETYDPDGDPVSVTVKWYRDNQVRFEGATLDSGLTTQGQSWKVTVTPNDGTDSGETVSAEFSVVNAPPEITSLTWTPDTVHSDTTIVASPVAVDADGDLVTLTFDWYVDGEIISSARGSSLSHTHFTRGQVVELQVTPDDGNMVGETVSTGDIPVQNYLPVLDSVTLTPDVLIKASTATCVPGSVSDDDGDDVTISYSWRVDGSPAPSSENTLEGTHFDRGQEVTCIATPNDGYEDGAPVTSDPVVVSNSPPSLDQVTLDNTSPAAGDSITATATGEYDADGDPVTVQIDWYVNNAHVYTGTTLSDTYFRKNEVIYAVGTPSDGTDDGEPVQSLNAHAVNTAPSITGVDFDPALPSPTDVVTAVPTGWSDPDGDPEGYYYTWYVNGYDVSDASSLDLSLYSPAVDTITVDVTPWDGQDTGTTVTSAAVAVASAVSLADADGMILGVEPGDLAGFTGIFVGDLNADGRRDILAGAPGSNGGMGAAHLLLGRPFDGHVWELSDADRSWHGAEGAALGSALAGGMDLDGDGYPDLVLGAPGLTGAAHASGGAWIIWGPAHEGPGVAPLLLAGACAEASLGAALAMGDTDGDGVADLLVGAPGAGTVHLVYGGDDLASLVTMTSAMADATITGPQGSAAGTALAMADMDGDGLADILIGGPEHGDGAGAAWLLSGPVTGAVHMDDADATFHGVPGGALGESIAFLESPSGHHQVVLGAPGDGQGGAEAGAIYLFHGDLHGTVSLQDAHAVLLGHGAGTQAGASVTAGPMDHQGQPLLVVGAPGADEAGAAYVLEVPGEGVRWLATAGVSLTGELPGDLAGSSVSLGDFDGDGFLDILVGAPGQSTAGHMAGAIYLVGSW